MSAARAAALVGLCAALAACGGQVVFVEDGGEGGGSSGPGGPSGPSASSGGTDYPDPPTAIVIDAPANEAELRISDFGRSCASPDVAPPYADCGWVDVRIFFPASYLDGPRELDPYDDAVRAFVEEAGNRSGGGCAFSSGGGDGLLGEVSFASVDGSSVLVTLSGWDDLFTDARIDGEYRAERCGI